MSPRPQSESVEVRPLLCDLSPQHREVCPVLYWLWVLTAAVLGFSSFGFLVSNLAPAPRSHLTSLAPALRNRSLHGLARAAQSLGDNASWQQEFFEVNEVRTLLTSRFDGRKVQWSYCAKGSQRICHAGLTGVWHLSDENESYTFYFFKGRLINETGEVPKGCREIHRRDEVAHLDAECQAFCSAIFGAPSPWSLPMQRQLLASVTDLPDFVRVSTHACSLLWPAVLLEPLRHRALQWSLVVLYALIGFVGFLVFFKGTAGYEAEVKHDYTWKKESTLIEGEGVCCSCCPSPKLDLRKLDLPLCCINAGTDEERAKWQVVMAVPFALLDNPLDVLTLTNFAITGRMFFFIATALGIAFTGLADPFQAKAYAAGWSCWRRGFPGRKWLEHQAHEGCHEAPIAGFIALASLAAAPVGAVDLRSLAINTASGLSSLAMAVPKGKVARQLLKDIDNGQTEIQNDYVEQEEAKKGVPMGVKFGFSAQVLTAVAAVGLFPRLNVPGSGYFLGALVITCHLVEDFLKLLRHLWELLDQEYREKFDFKIVQVLREHLDLVEISKVMPPFGIAVCTCEALVSWIKEPHGPAGYVQELWSTLLSGWEPAAAAAAVQLSLLLLGGLAVPPTLVWSIQAWCKRMQEAKPASSE